MSQKFNPFTGNFDTVLDKASEITYDNTTTGLASTDTQAAIDEVAGTVQVMDAELTNVQTLTGRPANSSDLGTFTGSTISDDVNIKTALQELETAIESIPDPVTYKGTYNATTNSPALANSDTGKVGFLYQVAVAGTQDFGSGNISFDVGDKVVNDGSIWSKWDMTDAVTSVNGQAGAVVLSTSNIAEGTNQYFTNERAQDAIAAALDVSASVTFNYDDTNNLITADVNPSGVDKNALGGSELSIANGGTGQTTANAALNALLPTQTTANLKFLTSDGSNSSWSEIQQVKNYITNANALVDTTGWATFADGSSLVDGTDGTATAVFTRSTSGPLRGIASFLYTPGALGNGVSAAFTIDEADKAKVLQVTGEYQLSGTITEGDYQIWIYDVTNSQLIQPAGYKLSGTSGTNYKFNCTFQTASNSTSYRLIIWQAVATSVTLKFDNVIVTPQVVSIGGIATDWQTFTPTGSFTTNTSYSGKWRRVGDTMQVQANLTFSGAPNSTTFTLNLPSGYSIDTAKLVDSTSTIQLVGSGAIRDTGANLFPLNVFYNSTTSVTANPVRVASAAPSYADHAASLTQAAPFTIGSTDTINLTFSVPIQGWGTSQVLSSETDTRVVAAAYGGQPTGTLNSSADNIIKWPSSGLRVDTHGAYSTSTGLYTVQVPGVYEVKALVRYAFTASASKYANAAIGIDGVMLDSSTGRPASDAVDWAVPIVQTYNLRAGQTIGIYSNTNCTSPTFNGGGSQLSITRISGPSQIAASESINVIAEGATATVSSTLSNLTFTEVHDSHGVFDGVTFTASSPGVYSFYALTRINGTYSTGQYAQISILKGSTVVATKIAIAGYAGGNVIGGIDVSKDLRLLTGETVKVQVSSDATSPMISATAPNNNFSAKRVGN